MSSPAALCFSSHEHVKALETAVMCQVNALTYTSALTTDSTPTFSAKTL